MLYIQSHSMHSSITQRYRSDILTVVRLSVVRGRLCWCWSFTSCLKLVIDAPQPCRTDIWVNVNHRESSDACWSMHSPPALWSEQMSSVVELPDIAQSSAIRQNSKCLDV